MDSKLIMSLQYAFATKMTNSILGCIRKILTSKSSKMRLPLSSALVRPHLQYCVQIWACQCGKDTDLLEQIQHCVTKMMEGLEHLPYEEMVRKLE